MENDTNNTKKEYSRHINNANEITLISLIQILMKKKWAIFTCTFLFSVIALSYALVATPMFRARVLLSVVEEKNPSSLSQIASQFGHFAALAGVNLGGGDRTRAEVIAFLKSRILTETFIKTQNLMPILFEKLWNADDNKWEVENQDEIPTMWDAFLLFDSNRAVSEDLETGLITLTVDWKDPKLAVEWTNKYVKLVNELMRNNAIEDAENNLKYLNKALNQTSSVEVHDAIYRIIESQIKTIMFAKAKEEFAFKVIDPPVIPRVKVKPKRKLIVISGFFLGLTVGVFFTLFLHYYKAMMIKQNEFIDSFK